MAMLVLTRKVSEKLVIDGGITVEIIAIKGNRVSIGVSAPPGVRVDREEVYLARMEFSEKRQLTGV
jgi:carbon storage regulator